jgi:hypothetical protein
MKSTFGKTLFGSTRRTTTSGGHTVPLRRRPPAPAPAPPTLGAGQAGPSASPFAPPPAPGPSSPAPGTSPPTPAAPPQPATGGDAPTAAPGAPVPPAPAHVAAAPAFSLPNVNRRSRVYAEKADRLRDLLASHPSIRRYLNGRPCRVVLERRSTKGPAQIVVDAASATVYLATYFFEEYDLGYVAGMLCHEFGIHGAASNAPGIAADAQLQGRRVEVPGSDGALWMSVAGAVQADHVLGAMPNSVRHKVYRRMALEMADLLLQAARAGAPGTRERDVIDLLDCYLMDLASIAATNDHRLDAAPPWPGSQRLRDYIARAYEAYRQNLLYGPEIRDINADLPDLLRQAPDKTAEAVERDYWRFAYRLLTGQVSAPSLDG